MGVLMSQNDLAVYGAYGLLDARARVIEYRKQLSEISLPQLRKRLLEQIAAYDWPAWRLMKND
jgi:hypothetical protein